MINRLYLDIETSPLPLLEKFKPDFQAPRNLKDPDKIKAAIDEKIEEWTANAALHAVTGQILAITWALDNGPILFSDKPEKELLTDLTLIIKTQLQNNRPVYTWNGASFDFPFICQRAAVYRMPLFRTLTDKFRGRYYWNENLVDARAVWSMYSSDYRETSLGKVALALGVGQKNGDGKNFSELLKSDPAKAIEYAKNDCLLLRGVVEAMGI
jgi:DNA polymerase elongation subunit (family B)